MEDFKEMHKIHIGISPDNSDNESNASLHNSFYESLKPIPYTDHEIASNVAIVNPDGTRETCFAKMFPVKIKESYGESINSVKSGDLVYQTDNLLQTSGYWPEELQKLICGDFCKLCNLIPQPKSDSNHCNSYIHNNNIQLWLQNNASFLEVVVTANWPENLKELVLPNICKLCNVNISSPNILKIHYRCTDHRNRIKQWLLHSHKFGVPTKNYTKELKLQGNQRPTTAGAATFSSWEYCFICSTDFKRTDNHRKTIMHHQIHNLVMSIISRGFSIEVGWITLFKKDVSETNCNICSVTLKTPMVAIMHFNSETHATQCAAWFRRNINPSLKEIVDKIDTKWCYCMVCQRKLDGTSCAKYHYRNIGHIKKEQGIINQFKKSTNKENANISQQFSPTTTKVVLTEPNEKGVIKAYTKKKDTIPANESRFAGVLDLQLNQNRPSTDDSREVLVNSMYGNEAQRDDELSENQIDCCGTCIIV
ncbi:uncharacterized protein LOC132707996 isoform X2 [Cylas formicarius]|uniref:uncharacterized protein LOC132707996 isoform X2 n=1 Tax=Cylas formicarius TaxID=197179 RepID=UPI0029588C41|nr:uncharacterized protein LOC132707996 isoform X2 [Cylas formicarius]